AATRARWTCRRRKSPAWPMTCRGWKGWRASPWCGSTPRKGCATRWWAAASRPTTTNRRSKTGRQSAMLRIEADVESPIWETAGLAWDQLAAGAVHAAVRATPYDALDRWPDVAVEISLRFVDDETIRDLNRDYRGKDSPTNVPSFPTMEQQELLAPPPPCSELLVGDLLKPH